jgi:hypothetical protein
MKDRPSYIAAASASVEEKARWTPFTQALGHCLLVAQRTPLPHHRKTQIAQTVPEWRMHGT